MLILALDTTTRAGSIAIVSDGAILHELSGEASLTHAQRLPADLDRACTSAGIEIAHVDLFAVAAGPGSFTGLRIGIAAIQGLATAWGRRVVPVSTLEALAAAAGAARVAAWLDAQRGEVFAQVFSGHAGTCEPLVDAISSAPETVIAAHRSELDGAVFHGDGALRYRDEIHRLFHRGVTIIDPPRPLAGAIGQLAARHPERAVAPHAIMPVYVRRPDAELARERRSREV